MTEEELQARKAARTCGDCYACCVHLGINALHKWPGQTCKHLDGRQPEARCKVYATRPQACVTYTCAWRQGMLSDADRPNRNGILLTLYRDETDPTAATATVHVIDRRLSGIVLQSEVFQRLLNELVSIHVEDIRIIDVETKQILHLKDGEIYKGKVLHAAEPEMLTFESYAPSVGRFMIKEGKSDVK